MFLLVTLLSTGGARAFPIVMPLHTTIAGDVVADMPRVALQDLGGASADRLLNIALTLRYRNQAELDQLVELQNEKGSPLYRHWLSNAEFSTTFSPSVSDYVRVIRSLERAGFRITSTYSNRTVVDAVGSIAAIDRYFGTEIHLVRQPGYGVRYANVRPAHAPIDLGSLVHNVDGLNTLTLVHPFYASAKDLGAAGRPRLPYGIGPPLFGPSNPSTGLAGYGPLAFAGGYDLPVQHKTPKGGYYDGTGRASAIVIDADFLNSDLKGYLSYFHIARTAKINRVLIDGGPNQVASGDSIEATADVETIASLAPGTTLYVYEFPSLGDLQGVTDAYNRIVSDNDADTANSSFGGVENLVGKRTAKAWDAIFEQGASKGITFHASTGDGGGGIVAVPASSPHSVAVGGTVFTVANGGKRVKETGWSGSSGGVSQIFALPAWQARVRGIRKSGRNLPDVAFDASIQTGEAFYYGGTFFNRFDPFGGTSLSSPIFGAIITEIDQVEGGRIGLAGKALFELWEKEGYETSSTAFFYDITRGSSGAYSCARGYDLVTGIGSLDAWNIANQL